MPFSSTSSGRARRPLPRCSAGFTLVEIVITLVIVAILAALAMPSFIEAIRKGRRSEAFAAVTMVQQAQERWRASNPAYADLVGAGGEGTTGLGLPELTPTGYYRLSLANTSATGYDLLATGEDGTTQAGDSQCRRLGVRVRVGNLTYAGCGSCTSFGDSDYTDANPCWAR
jgi:type IV pilus assembly protein PilE